MTTPDAPTASTSAPAPKTASLWEDFIDVFYAPRAVFERRRDGRFGVALLIYTVLTTAIFAFTAPMMAPIFEAQQRTQVEKMRESGVSEEQIQQVRSFGDKMQGPMAIGFAAVGTPITIVVIGALLWLAGKIFGSAASFSQSMMVATYANVPRLLGMLVNGVLMFFGDPSQLTSMASLTYGPARFMPEGTDPAILALLGRVDLFTIWVTILLGIGLAVVGRIPRAKAFGAAAVVFVIGTLGMLLQALRAAA